MTKRIYLRRLSTAVVGLGVAMASAGQAGAVSPVGKAVARGTHDKPLLVVCQMSSSVKPKSVILACADDGLLLKSLKWSTWGPAGASATGTISWHICQPDCAASDKWGSSSATVQLSDLVDSPSKYGWVLQKLTVHITGAKTGGFGRTLVYPEKP